MEQKKIFKTGMSLYTLSYTAEKLTRRVLLCQKYLCSSEVLYYFIITMNCDPFIFQSD